MSHYYVIPSNRALENSFDYVFSAETEAAAWAYIEARELREGCWPGCDHGFGVGLALTVVSGKHMESILSRRGGYYAR